MRAEQLIYTSCRQGQSGHPGFQIRGSSIGLPAEDEKEILLRGDYKPPTDLPALPEPDSGFHSYPVAFHFYRLPSGKLAATRSVYAGRDGGGRPGNFLAHSLIFEDELQADCWPIDLIEWAGWRGPLTPAERDSEAVPPSLSAIDFEAIPAAESFGWPDLAEFLEEDPRRRSWFAAMIEAVVLGPETSRPVLIRCPALDAAFWIACLQKTLPPELSTCIGFSTYQYAPRGCTDVNVSSGRTSFEFNDDDRRHRYFVFDWDEDVRSEVEGQWPGHGASVALALCEQPELLSTFYAWLRALGAPTLDRLPVAWASYVWLAGGVEVGKRTIADWIQLWSEASSESLRTIQNQFWQRLESEEKNLSFSELEGAVSFFFDETETSDSELNSRRGVELWLRLLVRSLKGEGDAIPAAVGIWRQLASLEPRRRAILAGQILEAEPWAIDCSSAALDASSLLLEVMVRAMGWNHDEDPWQLDLVRAQVRKLGEDSAGRRQVLGFAAKNPLALGGVIEDLSQVAAGLDDPRASLRDLGAALVPILESIGESKAAELRRRLEGESRWEVLFGEWLAWLDAGKRAGNAQAKIRQYEKEVLPQVPHFEEVTRGWRAASLLEGASDKQRRRQALEWLDSGELERLPRDLQQLGLRLANEAVPLDFEDALTEERADKLGLLAVEVGVPLEPDRPYLWEMLRRVGEGRLDVESMRNLSAAMKKMPSGEAEVYVDRLLPVACRGFTNLKDHERFLENFHHRAQPKRFRKLYTGALSSLKGRSLVAALRFWLSDRASQSRFDSLALPARSSLEKNLLRLPEEEFDKVVLRLTKSESSTRQRWGDVQSKIERRRGGLIGKTVRWLDGFGRRHDSDDV